VSTLLRALSLPGAEQVFALVCSPPLRDAGNRLAAWLGGAMLRPAPVVEEIWRSYAALADDEARRAFFRTLRAVIDARGQSVCATDRLYLAALVPTLIVWGGRDALIPVEHARAAHEAIPGSRLEIFDDAGHLPHCEAPERFIDTLVGFIDSTVPPHVPVESWRELVHRRSQLPEGERPSPSASATSAVTRPA
jgi:pimeloyl-ACP methyl ester carboxylesterase